jgi:putative spermidine/putrescine transport system substrate-binding protein
MGGVRGARLTTTRRVALAGAASALSTPFLARRASASDVLYINTWGGRWEKSAFDNLFNPFTAKTGIEIKTVSPVSYAKLVAQARTGAYDFDVTTVGLPELVGGDKAGVLEPINTKVVDVESHAKDAVFHNGVASHVFSVLVSYNKKTYPNGGPQSWADFWNIGKFPGERSMMKQADIAMLPALVADGVPKDKLFPVDIERSLSSLDRIKPKLRVWWTQGSQSQQLLRDGEVDCIGIWHGQALILRDQGLPVDIVWNEQLIQRVYWVVSKGTPRSELAWRFIDFATSAKPLAGFCKQAVYGPLNPQSFEFIPEADQKDMPTSPRNYINPIEYNAEDIGRQTPEMIKRFDQWLAS